MATHPGNTQLLMDRETVADEADRDVVFFQVEKIGNDVSVMRYTIPRELVREAAWRRFSREIDQRLDRLFRR